MAKHNPGHDGTPAPPIRGFTAPYYCAAETIFSAKLRLMDDKRNMMGYALSRREVPPPKVGFPVQVLGGQS
jgi:hypothetical protein